MKACLNCFIRQSKYSIAEEREVGLKGGYMQCRHWYWRRGKCFFFLSQDYSLNDVSGMEMLKQTPQDKEREALWRAASMEVIQPPREEHWDQVHWQAWSKMMSPCKRPATESLEMVDMEEEKEEFEVSDKSSMLLDGGLPLAVCHAMKSKGKSRMRLADLQAEEVNDDVDSDDEEMDQEDYGLDRMEPGPSDTGDEIMTVVDPEPPAPVPVPGGPVSRIPFGSLPPSVVKLEGSLRNMTTSCSS